MSRGRMSVDWQRPVIAGVCAQLAARLGIDVTLVRALFVVLVLASGLGVFLYAGLWLVMGGGGETLASRAQSRAARVGSGMRQVGRRVARQWQTTPGQGRTLAFGLLAIGGLALLWSFGAFAWLSIARALALAAIVAGGFFLFHGTELRN